MLDLEAIRARAEAATPGPWEASSAPDYPQGNTLGWDVMAAPRCVVAGAPLPQNDAAFIAHSREDVPKLLAEVERLRSVEQAAHRYVRARAEELSDRYGELKLALMGGP
jgi:hypothetical protein